MQIIYLKYKIVTKIQRPLWNLNPWPLRYQNNWSLAVP